MCKVTSVLRTNTTLQNRILENRCFVFTSMCGCQSTKAVGDAVVGHRNLRQLLLIEIRGRRERVTTTDSGQNQGRPGLY